MLLKTLRNSYPVQISLFIIIPLLLWVSSFISPEEVCKSEISGPLYDLIYTVFHSHNFVSAVVAFILVMIQGLLVNVMFSTNLLTPKTSFLPAVLFVMCSGFLPEFHTISPVLFVNLFFLLSLKYLFRAYNISTAFDAFFNAGLCLAIAALIYPPAWVLLLLIPVSIVVYRVFKWRVIAVSLLGVLFPCIIVVFAYWFTDNLNTKWLHITDFFYPVPQVSNDENTIFLNIATVILLLIAVGVSFSMSSNNIMSTRKRTLILYFSTLLMLIVSFRKHIFPVDITYLACFFAFAFTHMLYKKWKTVLLYLALLLLITTIVVGNLPK